jgi:hypothetical protein
MMHDSWTCLTVEKGPGIISDEVRNVLKAAACDLHLKRWDQMPLENDLLTGIIKTEWNTYRVGGRSGVLFRAQVDCEDGTDYRINFLFNERDLERGAEIIRHMKEGDESRWSENSVRIPIPELYQFYDLLGPGHRLH